jgi:RNA polymerase sigma-70 factor (ECF subfamily)
LTLGPSQAYARLLAPIRAKCLRLLGNRAAAEDVAQETFLRLLKSGPDDASEPRVVMAGLYRTCTRLSIDALRDRRRVGGGDDDLGAIPCGVDVGASLEARAAIVVLAGTVPEDELAVAVVCRIDGLAQPEAAGVLGVSERTVRRMLERFDRRTEALRKEFAS